MIETQRIYRFMKEKKDAEYCTFPIGYSVNATFASNTTVTSSRRYQGDPAGKFFGNLSDSLVPAALRDPSVAQTFNQPNGAGALRDNVFAFYQPNLIFGMGLVGGPLVLSLLYAAWERRKSCGPEGRFWLGFIPCCILAGILVVGERDPLGDAHLVLLSLEVKGLALLAGRMPLRRTLAAALVAGCIADFSLGIALQARVENLENTPSETVFSGLTTTGGTYRVGDPGPHSLSVTAGRNWFRKHQYELCKLWLAQLAPYFEKDAAAQPLARELDSQLAEDRTGWDGWYSRHNGSVQFLGDHVTSSPAMAGAVALLLLALFGAVLRKLWEGAAG